MKHLLVTTALIEVLTGLVLLAVPAQFVSFLLGVPLDTTGGLAVGRLAGAALVTLAIACRGASSDEESRAAVGVVTAMLLYNIAVVVLFVCLRGGAGLTGPGLLPATIVHAVMTVWCIACLRSARSPGKIAY